MKLRSLDGKDATTPGSSESKVSPQRRQWNRCDEKPEGLAYNPFYGKRRSTSWREKQSDTVKGIRLNWICRYPQKKDAAAAAASKKTDDDHCAGNSVEALLSMLAAHLGFAYVWIIRGPRIPTPFIDNNSDGAGAAEPTPEWSVGVCFGNEEKRCTVYGNIYVTVDAENSQMVTGLRKEGCETIIPGGGRSLDLWVADAAMPQPFAPRKKKPRKPRYKKNKDKKTKVADELKKDPATTTPAGKNKKEKKAGEDGKAKPSIGAH
ncbi:uncharacterized protein PG986_005918 [Apiospora aurea]|uniref:Uncharacterized protein n=1 Tax=Apiospora aurea TaxID=335848 RepID=A0ABR1QKB0_9PEZI